MAIPRRNVIEIMVLPVMPPPPITLEISDARKLASQRVVFISRH